MTVAASYSGWSRIAANLDVEIRHGVPVCISCSGSCDSLDEQDIVRHITELTGFTVSLRDWTASSPDEQQWSVCIDDAQFERVLLNQALASAALFVDRYHRPIDRTAVDWDLAEFNHDFNTAIERCCLPYDSIVRQEYFTRYVDVMHKESVRLIEEVISPLVETE